MNPQQYSLRWNNHQPNFISMFASLLNSRDLVDVTLAAEGQQLMAHKLVLSACSTFFHSLFVDNPCSHPIVVLKDISYADLRILVDFMYYGQVNVTQQQLTKVLDAANNLKIKGLTERPETASVMQTQGTSADLHGTGDSETQTTDDTHLLHHCASQTTLGHPCTNQPHLEQSAISSPKIKKKMRTESSGSIENEEYHQDIDPLRGDPLGLNMMPQQRCSRESVQQTPENRNMNVEGLDIEMNSPILSSGGQWSMVEHTYPRYGGPCLSGGGLQPDAAVYMNNVMNAKLEADYMNDYGQIAPRFDGKHPSAGPSGLPEQQLLPEAAPQPPARRRRISNPQGEENFQKALEAVRFGGIGFCKAARMFGVNNRTLWLEYKKKGYPISRPSIKNRIKRENSTPPPKEDIPMQEQQMALLCPTGLPTVGFLEPRALEFQFPGAAHTSPLSLLGVNFGSLQ